MRVRQILAPVALSAALLGAAPVSGQDLFADEPQFMVYRGDAREVLRRLEPDPAKPPREGLLLAILAYCHAVIGDDAGAASRASDALAAIDRDALAEPLAAATRAWAWTAQGALLRRRGELEAAESRLREAAEALPTMAASRYEQGELHREIADRILAERTDSGIPPDRLEVRRRRLESARAAYDKASRLGLWYPMAIRGSVRASWALGEFAVAMDRLEAALTDHPDEPLLLLERGVLSFELQRYDAAVKHIRRVLELCPDWTIAWVELGNALDMQDRFEEAEAAYRKAIELDPAGKQLNYNLAVCLARQGKWGAALETLDAEQKVNGRDPLVHRFRIEVLKRLGREKEIPEVQKQLEEILRPRKPEPAPKEGD